MSLDRLRAALSGRYRIERELGQGGMATVYLAEDVRHRRKVALKVLHPELSAVLGPERFLKEIELTASLQHPHILALFDSGEAEGQLFYVMPFVEGETLRARLDREKQLPITNAVQLAREVADALQYAHERGVIHRDIKPEKILRQGGHALVADFGIALAVQQAGGARMTQTGLSLGTPQYMSPEQATGERTIDARSDIYALGAVTYEMLVGEAPFTGATVQQIVARVLSEEPRSLVASRRAIPEHIETVVLHALEKLPADRFTSAAEFATALGAPHAVTGRMAASRGLSSPSRRPLIALGVVALTSLGAAAWGWMRPVPRPEVVRYQIVIDSVPAVKDWRGELAISPDGSVIVRSGGPKGTLLVRRRDQLSFSSLAGTEDAIAPFFTMDGTRVAWTANNQLRSIPLAGGPVTVLADSQTTSEAGVGGVDGYVYRNIQAGGLWVIGRSEPSARGPVEPVTTLDTAAGELTHMLPEVLPDHKTLLFKVAYRNGEQKIAVTEVGSGRHEIVIDGVRPRYAPNGDLVYTTQDGKLWAAPFDVGRRKLAGDPRQIADRIPVTIVGPVDFAIAANGTLVYSVDDAGTSRALTWVDRNGRSTPFDSTWKGEFTTPTLSPDGSRVAVVIRDGSQSHVWTKSVAGGSATRLTLQHRTNFGAAWSPDGRWVSYLVGIGVANSGDVWKQPADGSGRAVRVLHSARPLAEQVTVPRSGDLLVRTTTPTVGTGDILVSSSGDTLARPVVSSPHSEYSPSASPDGRWMAYSSNETGRFEVYVVEIANPGSAKWPVSSGGGLTPRWSPRGDELFYIDLQSNLVAARVTTSPSFAIQGSRVLFNASGFVFPAPSRHNFDVAPDGQRFLMVQRADGARSGRVEVIEHLFDKGRRTAVPR